jgi:sulfate permease, SulP family
VIVGKGEDSLMHRFRHLAVGLDRTKADAKIISYAGFISRLGAVESVRFVHVLAGTDTAQFASASAQVLAELRSAVADHFTGVPPSVNISYDCLADPLTDSLLAHVAERQIDLLLVGHRRAHSGRRALARRLAMKAPCSVWMVPEDSPATIQRILVPIDFSDHAADTLRVAVGLARLTSATCVPLHVYFNEAVVTFEGYDQILRGEEAQAYERFIAPIDCQGVKLTPVFEEGSNVAHVIGRVAERLAAHLTVMGTRGRSRSAAILLGSVTEEAIMETRIPLLAVKHYGARLGVLQALLDQRFLRGGGVHTD